MVYNCNGLCHFGFQKIKYIQTELLTQQIIHSLWMYKILTF